MGYFRLNHSTEASIIGRAYPQHQTMGKDYDFQKPNSVHKLSNRALLDLEPDFNTVNIENEARLTDFISSSPLSENWGFLISDKVRRCLDRIKLPPHRYYELPVVHKGRSICGYYFINIITSDKDIDEIIDFNKSSFFLLPGACLRDETGKSIFYVGPNDSKQEIEISSNEEYQKKLKNLMSSYEYITSLKENASLKWDIFRFSPFSIQWYVSESLAQILKEERVCGIDLKKEPVLDTQTKQFQIIRN